MPIIVDLPDGSSAEFPDGTAPDVIKSSLAKKFGSAQPAPAKPEPSIVPDVIKSAGAGLVRGVAGLAGLPGDVEKLVDAGLSYVMPETMARSRAARQDVGRTSSFPTSQGNTRAIESVTGPLYRPQTTAGRYADTIAQFAPAVAAGPGGMVQKALTTIGAGGGSEFAGQMTQGTAAEPWARFGGAIAGGMLPNAVKRGIVPFEPNARYKAHVDTLRRAGVADLTAGEATGSRFLKFAESHANDLPFSGGGVMKKNQAAADQFNAAVMKTAGSNATDVSSSSIDNMFTALGKKFDDLVARTGGIPIRGRTIRAAKKAADDYYALTSAAERRPLIAQIAKDIDAIATPGHPTPGWMPANQYQVWRSQLSAAARGTKDPTSRRAIENLQAALDDAVGYTFKDQALRDAWKQTRREYANAKIIDRAADPSSGNILPRRLVQAGEALRGSSFKRGKSDLSALAYAGKEVMRPMPNSGTPARQAVDRFFNAPAQMFASALGGAGATVGGVVGGAAGFAGPGLVARGTILSGPGQRWLGATGRTAPQIQNGLPGVASTMAGGLSAAAPADIDPAILRRLAFAQRMNMGQ